MDDVAARREAWEGYEAFNVALSRDSRPIPARVIAGPKWFEEFESYFILMEDTDANGSPYLFFAGFTHENGPVKKAVDWAYVSAAIMNPDSLVIQAFFGDSV